MDEHCPSCGGVRIPDDPDVLPTFDHEPACALLAEEHATLDTDRRRAMRSRALVRHRAATGAERLLVAAAGVRLDRRAPLHVRVEWVDAGLRLRLLSRAGLVAADEVPS